MSLDFEIILKIEITYEFAGGGDTMTPKNINFHAYRVGYYIIRTYIRIYTRGTRENFRIWCHMCPCVTCT